MTRIQRNGKPPSGFSEWVRNEPDLDSRLAGVSLLDIDWIWHQYRVKNDRIGARTVNHILLIEEKQNNTKVEFSQRDTMFLLHQLFEYIDGINNLKWLTLRGVLNKTRERVSVRFWGYYVLAYDGFVLATAEKIMWNKRQIKIETLKKILLFELNPKTLKPYSERRHHPPKPEPLFDKVATL